MNFLNIPFFHTEASHNIDSSVRSVIQFPQKFHAGQRVLLLSGRENGFAAELNCVLQRPHWVACHVERAVQCHIHPTCAVHHPAHALYVQIAVRRQRADHNAVRAKFAVHPDLLAHLLLFFLAVKKITEARTDQNIRLNRNIALHLPEQCRRRCCSTDDKMRTQFQPVRAAKPRRPAGSVRIHTSFN